MEATQITWQTLPAPHLVAPLDLRTSFTSEEFLKIKAGYIPEEMEEKWFIYYADGWLNFHRSWTGFLIYRLQILQLNNEFSVLDSWVNRDPEQYQCVDVVKDREIVMDVINNLLLARAVTPAVENAIKTAPKKTKVDGQITGLSGEFFVAAELLKRDMQTSLTFGNAKSIDIFSYNQSTNKTFNVQVKSLRKKNWFLISPDRIVRNHIYVFVILNLPGISPQYYIVPGHVFLDTPERFYPGLNDPKMPGVSPKQLAAFENSWEVFLN
ncbi:hypothetical protein HQ393_11680 [Chitinibacter bivalviorum]|uniref:Uncharacterized protein n=1 Tax=Chitinibacter bivalviorum TaxID=2739434 RepID=A0A7H9BLE5_9NEIS|nr:hypothetical protein [Chitinibacter bivalviorum]QLG88841.1 hypothetical protein HQ393_11680 [Chitinibacter bivalviorum]